jgi:hypothetical protein
LLRRRLYLVRQRSGLLTHLRIVNSQYNLPTLDKQLPWDHNQTGVAERFASASVQAATGMRNKRCSLGMADDLPMETTKNEEKIFRRTARAY